jgi:hypothetical protein
MIDRQLLIIIIFLGICFVLIAIFSMGLIPKIYQTNEKVDQTLIQQHEDEARENQSTLILRETNKSLLELEHRIIKFINESTNRSLTGQIERGMILDNIDVVQTKVENITNNTYDLLKQADKRNFEATINNKKLIENLTNAINDLTQLHDGIIKALDLLTKKLNS